MLALGKRHDLSRFGVVLNGGNNLFNLHFVIFEVLRGRNQQITIFQRIRYSDLELLVGSVGGDGFNIFYVFNLDEYYIIIRVK